MEENEVNLSSIFSDSVKFTVKYYKEMLGLVIPLILIGLTLIALQQVQQMFINNLGVVFLISMVTICVSLVSIYFSSRITVAIIIFIGDRHINKDFTSDYKECYKKAGDRVWSYIGISLLYGLIICIPVIVLIIAIVLIAVLKVWLFPMIIVAISLAVIIYLSAKFILSTYASVIEPAVTGYIGYSAYLSKGHMGKIILLMVVIQLIYVPLQLPNLLVSYNVLEPSLMVSSSRWFALATTTALSPFISSFMVMLYDKVVRSKVNEAEFKDRHPFLKQSVDNV